MKDLALKVSYVPFKNTQGLLTQWNILSYGFITLLIKITIAGPVPVYEVEETGPKGVQSPFKKYSGITYTYYFSGC